METNINLIQENLDTIYILANNNVKDKTLYKELLLNIEEYLPDVEDILQDKNSMTYQLNQYMQNLKDKINNVTDDPLSKIDFWINYMYESIWKTFRDSGIGHLYDFKIEHSCIHCFINIEMCLHKDITETNIEFEKRKEKFNQKLQNNDIVLITKNKRNYLEDNQYNKNYIINFIKNYCEPIMTEFTIRDNVIQSVHFVVNKDGNFSFRKDTRYDIKEETDLLSDIQIEKIIHDTKEWYQSMSFFKHLKDNNKSLLNDNFLFTIKHLSLNIYNSLCEICDVKNNTTKKYEELIMANKDSNLEARKKEEEIGSTYDIPLLIDLFKNTKSKLEDVLRINYCLYLDKFIMAKNKQLTLRFNSYCWFYNKDSLLNEITLEPEDYMFIDMLKVKEKINIKDNEDKQEALINFNEKNLYFFEIELAKILHSNIKDIKISYKNGIKHIEEITYEITDTKLFLEKYS